MPMSARERQQPTGTASIKAKGLTSRGTPPATQNERREAAAQGGFAAHRRVAKAYTTGIADIALLALSAGRRWKRSPRSHHSTTVNAQIGRIRTFMQPFCGPSSRNLAAYGRWHAARDNADRSYADVLRLLLASGPLANTVC